MCHCDFLRGMNQIVFLKDGKVVCHLYGYPQNNGYGILFEPENDQDAVYMLTIQDDLMFQVERNENIVFLRKQS